MFVFRQTVKNAGRGFAPDTQDDDIIDEVKRQRAMNFLLILKIYKTWCCVLLAAPLCINLRGINGPQENLIHFES